ncbi:hypothetical protein [Pedobacter zeae]|uniref:Uncharacterized protein n=1 Tax=Pedobacter zeae TaxID=1737356 RepID=A0A7W6K9J7_9SPHI|nr:hypothetical protein [Pedobacter zeae]MBB4107726.1 hypothetical protein [Pedobacter zeae]GGG97467.1 hypothetical protein GCM10007422_09280 [Pedobacter zeae]
MEKQITWKELKDFVNSIPEEFLDKKVHILVSDESEGKKLNEPFFLEEDTWCHKDCFPDDCGKLEDLKFMDDEFDINNYEIITPKGTPFLWIDEI